MKQLWTHGILFVALALTSTTRAQDWGEDPVDWITREGFSSIQFMERCVSVGSDGSQISSEPLPVGGDRWIACNTYAQVMRDVTEVQANDGRVYCVLGNLIRTTPQGDDRLALQVAQANAWGPAWVYATSSQPITISQVTTFAGARAWPIWLNSDYQTQQVVPYPTDGRTCGQVFGLSR